MRISDWSSDVCSSDLVDREGVAGIAQRCQEIVSRKQVLVAAFFGDAQDEKLSPPPIFFNRMRHGLGRGERRRRGRGSQMVGGAIEARTLRKIGRASCRERVCQYV